MIAKDLAKQLMEYPDAKVTVSISSTDDNHLFAEDIIEVTSQGKQLTIVMDVSDKNSVLPSIISCPNCDSKILAMLLIGIGFNVLDI